MVEIRGDIKTVNQGVMKSVDFLGCERVYSFSLLFFLATSNVLIFFSWFQLLLFAIYFVGLMIGRAIYKNDFCFFKIFFSNLNYDGETKHYLHPQSSLVKKNILKPISVRA